MKMKNLLLLSSILTVAISLLGVRCEIDFIAERLPLQGQRPHPGSPWPMPRNWVRSEEVMTVNPHNLTLTSNLENCDIIQQAFVRFRSSLISIDDWFKSSSVDHNSRGGNASFADGHVSGNEESSEWSNNVEGGGERTLAVLRVEVLDLVCPGYPQLGMTEDYNLAVDTEIVLSATSAWGVLRGLETCLQLMYTRSRKWYINQGLIQDSPRYHHRGLHMDTARHFYSVDFIKSNLVAMSMNKLNVFHWHIVDAQSFPYKSIKYPDLSKKGAFSPKHVYRQGDVREVIEYARLLGIRVIPEFDTPGHAHSWGKAMPDLLTPCWAGGQPSTANFSFYATRENFDPSKNATFEFLEDFFAEIRDVFQDGYLHLGMDEAHYMCWESSPDIATFMETMGFGANYSALEGYYNSRLLRIVNDLGKSMIVWEDPLNNGVQVPKSAMIQVWKGGHDWRGHLLDAVVQNYDVILSSCWYLNFISFGQDWRDFYTCDPADVNVSEEMLTHIQGGEACVWSEYLDETNMMQTVWPRASAMAERLWSSSHVNDIDQAAFRLDQHRCRMIRHGIPAQPILPGYCRDDYNTDNALNTQHPGSDVTSGSTDVTTLSPAPSTKATSTVASTNTEKGSTTDSNEDSSNGSNTITFTLFSLFLTFCLIRAELFH